MKMVLRGSTKTSLFHSRKALVIFLFRLEKKKLSMSLIKESAINKRMKGECTILSSPLFRFINSQHVFQQRFSSHAYLSKEKITSLFLQIFLMRVQLRIMAALLFSFSFVFCCMGYMSFILFLLVFLLSPSWIFLFLFFVGIMIFCYRYFYTDSLI